MRGWPRHYEEESMLTMISEWTYSRRDLIAAAFALAATAITPSTTQAASLEEIKARGYMIVATEDDYRPFEFIENGEPKGLDHDLLELLRKDAPFEIRQEIIPWTGLLAGVETGKYDLALTAVSMTPERMESLGFSMPITEATQFYVKRADDATITKVADLSSKVVGVQSGGASFTALDNLKATLEAGGGTLGEVVQYASFPEAYQDLANGRLDYVVNGVVNVISLTKENPERFAMGEAVGKPAYAAWAVAKDNTELLAYVNAFMAKVRAGGELAKLQEQWIGKSFDDMPTEFVPE